jgi:hypothetical protein
MVVNVGLAVAQVTPAALPLGAITLVRRPTVS